MYEYKVVIDENKMQRTTDHWCPTPVDRSIAVSAPKAQGTQQKRSEHTVGDRELGSPVRLCLLEMTGKLYLNIMTTKTRPKQWHQ